MDAENAATYRNYLALALLNDRMGVEVAYRCDKPEAEAEARFETLLQSVAAAGGGKETPSGFVTHQAKYVTLSVPASFAPPTIYSFADQEERAALVVTFVRSQDFDAEPALDAEPWELLDVSIPITRRVERDTAQNGREYIIYKATLRLSESAAAIVTARAALSDASELGTVLCCAAAERCPAPGETCRAFRAEFEQKPRS